MQKKGKSLTQKWEDAIIGNPLIKRYALIMAYVFLAALVIGYFFPNTEFLTLIIAYLQELVASSEGVNIYWLILLNNLRMALVTILLGVTVLYPFIAVAFNGYILGGIVSIAGLNSIWKILPHGIFEIPAIILACSLGLYLGTYWCDAPFKERLLFILRLYILVVAPLLLFAALIEGSLVYFLT